MKFNLMPVFVGGVVAIALSLFPWAVNANEAHQLISQLPPNVVESLNLTTDQQQKMQQIREATRSQLMELFTEEQLQQLRTSMEGGQSFGDAVAALNLPAERQTAIQNVLLSARRDAFGVLTPAQQQQVTEYVQSHQRNSSQP